MHLQIPLQNFVGNCIKNSNEAFTIACVGILIQNLLVIAAAVAGIAAVVLIMLGGVKFIMSGGEKEKVEGARKTITFALIGLFLIIFSFAIVGIIAQLTGVDPNQLLQLNVTTQRFAPANLTNDMCRAKHPNTPIAVNGQCCLTTTKPDSCVQY